MLNQVKSTKFLGLTIDETLSWKDHCVGIIKKMSKGLYQLRHSKHLTDIQTKIMLYYAFIHSHVVYGIPLWYQSPKTIRKKIKQKQIDAMKIIFNTNSRSEYIKQMDKYKIPSIETQSKIEYSKISFRYTENLLSKRIENLFQPPQSTYNTCNSHSPKIVLHSSMLYQNSYLCKSPGYYLPLPMDIKTSTNISTFKRKAKTYYLSQNQHEF